MTTKEITPYQTLDGKIPFWEWFYSLKETKIQARILIRLERLRLGNLGDYRSVGAGVFELRFYFGPGHRIYFAQDRNNIIILLCAGDKDSQNNDILKARKYWRDYQSRKRL